jgi:esterase/lipase
VCENLSTITNLGFYDLILHSQLAPAAPTPYHQRMEIIDSILSLLGFIAVLALLTFALGPRPRLNAQAPASRVPADIEGADLSTWLARSEATVNNLVDGTEARIAWHNPDQPAKTPLCFLYVHGFSASRQETAPVTERLAHLHNANIFDARLEGHGVGHESNLDQAESWLQSMVDAWDIASRIGDRVVIVATSTGAPLSIWLLTQPGVSERVQALLLMAPNFKIRSPFGFLLTWPWAPHWVQRLLGQFHEWEPETPEHGKYWTSRYSTLALIEMQKMVDWLAKQDLRQFKTPLAMMYLRNDTTIDPVAAVKALNHWGGDLKKTIPVTLDGDAAAHVFAGRLAGPHRTDWTVAEFQQFLKTTLA